MGRKVVRIKYKYKNDLLGEVTMEEEHALNFIPIGRVHIKIEDGVKEDE